ncbi:hypothetical protein I4U23_026048 [Adineta vaga]|nr:hypothetical protein I4U23_026048 [Adineta vaga]
MIFRTMFGKWNIPWMTMITYNQRLSLVIIILTSLSVLLVVTSAAAFIYVTRKEKILRKSHLTTVITIIFFELAFLIAVVSCCSIQSTNIQGQILAALLIVLSFLALMILIYFLLEDILKERVGPNLQDNIPVRTFTVQEANTINRPKSPIPPPPPPADEIAIPIPVSPVLPSLPRLPTPPVPHESPALPSSSSPPPQLSEKPASPPVTPSPSEHSTSSVHEQDIPQLPESPPPYVNNYERIRRDLLAAIEERTIPALEEAIQLVKDHDYIQPLKYECERALELLNRLMKIEHMKFSPVPWRRIRVLRLNQSTIAELHSYTKPPDEVLTVMRATFLLLGHYDREIQDWPQIQSLLGRFGRESIRRRCYELNPLSIPVDKAHEAKDILRNYDLIRVTEISVGLAAFFNWSITMVEEREKLLESQRRINR